jgi:hypothetical protein
MSAESRCDAFSVTIQSGLPDTCPFTRRTSSHPRMVISSVTAIQ